MWAVSSADDWASSWASFEVVQWVVHLVTFGEPSWVA
jgi:hypothetical protein